ncbi:hypothetical protein HPB48_004710 [Haemaphysalis longicornis]|uniref:Uncharacterized protein n=1 Tax=Haemaphysalis longicornis TaxID=44386 RepID=A0A9J6G101_HAELO|nr:hypothetical protein HPB48_004710 [Haemaphysalis longicornis]
MKKSCKRRYTGGPGGLAPPPFHKGGPRRLYARKEQRRSLEAPSGRVLEPSRGHLGRGGDSETLRLGRRRIKDSELPLRGLRGSSKWASKGPGEL